jgi:hypothetical protein
MSVDRGRDEAEKRAQMDLLAAPEELPKSEHSEDEQDDLIEELSRDHLRTTTGVIQIMRSSGREEVASLVEELHGAEKKVLRATQLAEELLKSLRKLHKKKTGHFEIPSKLRANKEGV